MPSRPFMQLFISDHLMDVAHLSAEEHGAYCFLLFAMWSRGGYLENNPRILARLARVDVDQWNDTLAEIIMPFLTVVGTRVTQKRLLKEMEKVRMKQRAGSEGGKQKAANARSRTRSRSRSKARSK